MRLGAPIFNYNNAQQWINTLLHKGYSAAYTPLNIDTALDDFIPYTALAKKHNISIAEFGVWNNPLHSNSAKRSKAIEDCKCSLFYADEIGAKCVVNISGSRGDIWDGPSDKNLTPETFDMVVEVVRDIIDSVKPKRTYYTLETMPWMYPNSIESYSKLIKAIDRKAFSVHFDPVNLITSPEKYFNNDKLITEFVDKLGQHIKSVHLKDILLKPDFMVHLSEVKPGAGNLNHKTLFKALSSLDDDLPVMIEHLDSDVEYDAARDYFRNLHDFIKPEQ